jgi:thiol-disulfide isomerase/thioredoxin
MSRRFFALVLGTLALVGAAHRTPTVFDLSDSVGRPVPALTLAQDDGTPLALDTARGEPTYVFLFASWCEPCALALPFVRADYERFGSRVRFVGVDVLEDAASARAALVKDALPFPVAIYPIEQLDATIDPVVQARSGTKYNIPADFLIDADGIVRFAWHGLALDEKGTPVDVLPERLAKLGIE